MGTYTTNDLSSERPLLYNLLNSIRANNSNKPKLIIEDELSEEEYDEIDIREEESRLLERLKKLEKLKQLKTLKDKRKEYIEKIKELTNEVLNIDKMISEFQEKSV
jgi:hypothetical protein